MSFTNKGGSFTESRPTGQTLPCVNRSVFRTSLNYTLSAAVGVFTLSGTGSITVGRVIQSSGNFTLTTKPATLSHGYAVGGKGTFTLSGQGNLLVGRKISGSAAYTLSGAGNLQHGFRIAGIRQTYTLSGQGNLIVQRKITGSAAYLFTGHPITISTTKTLTCGTGSFALSGSGNLKRSRLLYGQTMQCICTLNGQLTYGRVLSTSNAHFIYTPIDQRLTVQRCIQSSARFTLTLLPQRLKAPVPKIRKDSLICSQFSRQSYWGALRLPSTIAGPIKRKS
jgi:hypothetical protein